MSKFLNPLHTPEWIQNQINLRGRFELDRMTGRTTAKALRLIADAIENPYQHVTLSDHHVEGVPPYQLDTNIMHRVRTLCDTLELKHMHIDKIGGKYKLSFGKV